MQGLPRRLSQTGANLHARVSPDADDNARAVEKPAIRMLREDYWFRGVADNSVPLRVLTP
jgi:hypothetical protein